MPKRSDLIFNELEKVIKTQCSLSIQLISGFDTGDTVFLRGCQYFQDDNKNYSF